MMQRNGKGKGFTLIELLVVIAIIALLLSITMPGLQKAKQLAAASVCMSNNRQLGVAYYTYAEENDGYLADAKPDEAAPFDGYYTAAVYGRNYKAHSFVTVPINDAGAFSNTSLEDKIRGFEKGGLWAYLETPEIFNCPIDRRWRDAPAPGYENASNTIGGYRSYSLGGVLSADAYASPYTAQTGENKAFIIKYSEFSNPGSKITFLEESDPTGFNVNYWDVYLSERQWWDPFAIRHNGSSTFAYADGHADRHKWTDEQVIAMSVDTATNKTPQRVDENSDDYDWFVRSYVPGRIRK